MVICTSANRCRVNSSCDGDTFIKVNRANFLSSNFPFLDIHTITDCFFNNTFFKKQF